MLDREDKVKRESLGTCNGGTVAGYNLSSRYSTNASETAERRSPRNHDTKPAGRLTYHAAKPSNLAHTDDCH